MAQCYFEAHIHRTALWLTTNHLCQANSKRNLKTHVQNLGYPLPPHIGGQNLFWMTLQLDGNLRAYVFGMKHNIDNQPSALTTTRGLLRHLETAWTLVHKRLQTGPPFLPTLHKFCILFHCQASQMEISRWNSTTLCQTVDGKLC